MSETLSHDAALDCIVGAAGVTVLSYEEAIAAYFRLRGLGDPASTPPSRPQGEREITMQDVRLAVGEGKLRPQDVLAGCNAEMRRRSALARPQGEGGPTDLDRAWRAVDACGGSHTRADRESGYARGYDEALTFACAEIEKLGGRPS